MSGRGRAWNNVPSRGRGRGGPKHQQDRQQQPQSGDARAKEKFLEAQSRLQASVQKHMKTDYDSSSEEEDLETENILSSVIKSYSSQIGGNSVDLGRTQKFLEDAFQSGAAICLICIATVKRADAIWSCLECYCFFHVNCIQRWAKDSIAHQKQGLQERQQQPKQKFCWACPKCRKDYASTEIPDRYFCFCGKVDTPEFHPWLVPHTCGESCNKPLQPSCGHFCLLLCHPGPCPPCPKMVQSPCYCGKVASRPQRCSNKHWSCGAKCSSTLACGKHKCSDICHEGQCSPCPQRSTQFCLCGLKSSVRECAEPEWQCDKVCGRLLDCGNHKCEEVCHKGDCGPCPRSLDRNCPCGKSSFLLPCDNDTPTCGDTCGKTLECGQHKCFQRCHFNKCGLCVERVVKPCRCGLHSKEVPCAKEYLCETKCKRIRDCNYHACNRKCCDGLCPQCEKPCGKTLHCGNHKCQSVCHRGPCYPCARTVQVSCRCGETTIIVPCGRGIRSRPPRCSKQCQLPPDCHHDKRQLHKCHFGPCPLCTQKCGIVREVCGHPCTAKCHSAVLVDVTGNKPQGPWGKPVPQFELQAFLCDPCPEPIPVPCLGNHEITDLPCHRAFPTACGRLCGRALSCGIHKCERQCHTVLGSVNDEVAGENCESCSQSCKLPRPSGCPHPCPHACHLPPCRPCTTMLRLRCHCSLNQVFIRCGEYIAVSPEEQLKKLTCNNQCPKNYPCGHRCTSTCHPAECPEPESCRQKVKVFCKCKRIKKDFRCNAMRSGEAVVTCDEVCEAKIKEALVKQELEQKKLKELEEQRNKEELEKFQRKFQSRKKHRERRSHEEDEKKSFLARHWPWLAASGGLGLAVLVIYWL